MADVLAPVGVIEESDLDLWTAVQMGITDMQLANDPGGDRWTAQLDRAIDMFLDHIRHHSPSSGGEPAARPGVCGGVAPESRISH